MCPSTAPTISSTARASMTLLRRLLFVTGLSLGLLLCLLGLNHALADTNDHSSPDGLGSIAGAVSNEQGAPLAGIRMLLERQDYSFTVVRIVTTTATGAL